MLLEVVETGVKGLFWVVLIIEGGSAGEVVAIAVVVVNAAAVSVEVSH